MTTTGRTIRELYNRKVALISLIILLITISVFVSACGKASYKDGTYEGKSSVIKAENGDEGGDGYGVAKITIKDGKIVECDFKTYEPDGTLKDDDYGKQNGEIANQDYYNKAQKALAGSKEYAKELVESGDIHSIDAISGATISFTQFQEAVMVALNKAKE